jgi:hypothetical protein
MGVKKIAETLNLEMKAYKYSKKLMELKKKFSVSGWGGGGNLRPLWTGPSPFSGWLILFE